MLTRYFRKTIDFILQLDLQAYEYISQNISVSVEVVNPTKNQTELSLDLDKKSWKLIHVGVKKTKIPKTPKTILIWMFPNVTFTRAGGTKQTGSSSLLLTAIL